MAKRRRLETPSTDDLSRIEEQFRSETSDRYSSGRGVAPIAQMAADSASLSQTDSPDAREQRARLEADSSRLAQVQADGLLMVELPVELIDEAAMIRDRMVMDEDGIQELRQSISVHGLRLPIEVFELETPSDNGQRYGLLSGYRRLLAMRGLYELTQAEKYKTIRTLIRPRESSANAFVSMVEENEVREELSHFERGRVAVIAAQQGAFASTEEAVNKLFATGSKAKRSKIRSFSLIFEELGDMLDFPEGLTERRGLQLSAALRQGAESSLRIALSNVTPQNADEEWHAIEPVLDQLNRVPKEKKRGGRPKALSKASSFLGDKTLTTANGVTIRCAVDRDRYILSFEGQAVTSHMIDDLLINIRDIVESGARRREPDELG
ncbi:ParB N-terminal domain-containing protein [Paracoccus sp. JM45]|uniref:ParB/RepB/Spo0J family partition protein n=1 Tax=Paracoccus sp. JM45 TaxID=2283626 RepID=UPI000E6CE710|nr:ParB N-terminal domain-containing protein [Paracoccus sp. JM45]RJE79132.1 chromosome partitioning protein ParB [Paracoccus sp. JM45]